MGYATPRTTPTVIQTARGLVDGRPFGIIGANEYGATGDGTTDDTAALQAALDAAQPTGGVVWVPRGTYLISDPLVIYSNTTLSLAPDATIKLAAGSLCNMLNNQAVGGEGRDENIVVRGGVWNRQAQGGTGTASHTLMLRRVDGIRVEDLKVLTGGGKYAINLGDVTDYAVERISLATSSDGVHINGPADNGVVRDISGVCGDDVVSFTASDYVVYNDTEGNITNTLVERVTAKEGSGQSTLKIAANSGVSYVEGFTARTIYRAGNASAVSFADDTGDLDCRNVILQDISGRIGINDGTVRELSITGLRWTPTANSQVGIAITGTTITDFAIEDAVAVAAGGYTSNHLINIASGATITTMRVRGVSHHAANAYTVRGADGTVTVQTLILEDVLRDGVTSGGGVIAFAFSGATLTRVVAHKVVSNDVAWLADLLCTTSLFLGSISSSGINVRAGGNVTVRGESLSLGSSSNAGTLRSLAPAFGVNVALLARNAGDMALNTNGSLACGTGPVICNGTSWKHLYTGTEYTPA